MLNASFIYLCLRLHSLPLDADVQENLFVSDNVDLEVRKLLLKLRLGLDICKWLLNCRGEKGLLAKLQK